MKYVVGDLVYNPFVKGIVFEIAATKLDKRNIFLSEGFDYVIKKGNSSYESVFEEDIYLIEE
jgi:hypothetical protein